MPGTIDTYDIGGQDAESLERTSDFAMRSISDRLDRLEGIRGWPILQRETFVLRDGDTRPSVRGYLLYRTANTSATTITHFNDGFPSQTIDIIVGDDNTTFDFSSGNLRSTISTTWSAAKNQHLNAIFDDTNNRWYCRVSDAGAGTGRWQFVQFTGDRTLVSSDMFKFLQSIDATAQTVTVPTMASSGLAIGDQCSFYQYGAGQLTIQGATGVTINTPSNLTVNEQYGTVVIVAHATDEWLIAGRMTP